MGLQKNDILFAHIALNIMPGLSGRARAVGGALIEHFNKRTGQCDPSIERLARMLGMGRSAVVEATAELCEMDKTTGQSLGLFVRVTHGGRSHRTAYVPLWERFSAIVDDWDMRMKDGSAPGNGRKGGRSCAGNPAVDRPENRQQTDRINRQNKPTVQVEGAEQGTKINPADARQDRRKGAGKREPEPHRQRFLVHPIAGGKAASHQDAAESAEARRETAQINALSTPAEREAAWLKRMNRAVG